MNESTSTPTSLKERIALAAARTHRNPSLGQKEAGNYPKGHFPWNGHSIAIETPKGAIRTGVSKSGTRWAVQMPGHYGYIKRTVSDADGDAVDVIVGPHPESDLVCVVDQKTPGGKFDEHKVVIGCLNIQEARELYLACYSSGWTGMRSITPMTRQQFSVWLRKGDTGRPIDRQVSLYGKDQPRDELGRFSHADHVLKTAGEIESGWNSGALVSARELRKHSKLSKPDFDRSVYELATSRRIMPHKHDFATSLSPGELDELVDTAHGDPERSKIHANDGRYWVGFAKGKGEMKYSRVELAAARYAKSAEFDYTNMAKQAWGKLQAEAHKEFGIGFDHENDDCISSREIKFPVGNSEVVVLCELRRAGGDWESPSYYFRCQVMDGMLAGKDQYSHGQYTNPYFVLIPGKDDGNGHLEMGQKGKMLVPGEYSKKELDEITDENACWEFAEKTIRKMASDQQDKYSRADFVVARINARSKLSQK